MRDRAQQFYDLRVAGKFRATEPFVCEASLDYYSAAPKHSPASARVQTVKLTSDRKSAEVTATVEDEVNFGTMSKRMPMPESNTWRLEKKRWCLEVIPPNGEMMTPFGKVKLGGTGVDPAAAAAPPKPVDLAAQDRKIGLSKESFRLIPDEDGKDSLTFTNGLPGAVDLELNCPAVEGLQCSLSTSRLHAGEQARIDVQFTHGTKDLPAGTQVMLVIRPFGYFRKLPILPQ